MIKSKVVLYMLNFCTNPPLATITKAHITESLESLWSIKCEGYIESLQEHPFSQDSFSDTPSTDSNPSLSHFHPNALINQQAYLRITNPYPHNTKTGDKVVNEWFDDEINALLKEYNLD